MCPSKEIQENADQNEDIDNKQVSKMRDCEVVKIPTLPTGDWSPRHIYKLTFPTIFMKSR